jgi:hypothetical protein
MIYETILYKVGGGILTVPHKGYQAQRDFMLKIQLCIKEGAMWIEGSNATGKTRYINLSNIATITFNKRRD